jgi:hypothetical protein
MAPASGADPRAGARPTDQRETEAVRRRRRSGGVGQTIGGILVGFDEQVWRQRPPAQERVASTDRALRVSAPGGRTIELPSDLDALRPSDRLGDRAGGVPSDDAADDDVLD